MCKVMRRVSMMDVMKEKVKKFLKRVASGLIATIFAVCFVGAPRVSAVAVVDDVAVGAMSCEAFLASIGLPLTATGGSSAVTAGVTAAAGEYAAATGAAASGEAFLGTVAAGTAISTAGAIVLTAAAVVALGAFAYWLYENHLSSGDSAIVYEQSGYFDSAGVGVGLLVRMNHKPWYYQGTVFDITQSYEINGRSVYYDFDTNVFHCGDKTVHVSCDTSFGFGFYAEETFSGVYFGLKIDSNNLDLRYTASFKSLTDLLGEPKSESLSITKTSDYHMPQIQDTQQMVLDVGATPGVTLEELVQSIPEQVANNTFSPTYTIVIDPSQDPANPPSGENSGILDWIKSIYYRLTELVTGLAESVSEAIQTALLPSEEFTQELPNRVKTTFADRTGFLTYPISVLVDFVGDLGKYAEEDFIISWPDVAEPISGYTIMEAGSFNMSAMVRDNEAFQTIHDLWFLVAKGMMIIAFLRLCVRKFNSVVGDRMVD